MPNPWFVPALFWFFACGIGCAPAPVAEQQALTATRAQDLTSGKNADFESGNLSSWSLGVAANSNGLASRPPTSLAQLQLSPTSATAATAATPVLSGPACGSSIPSPLSSSSTLRYPRYGTYSALLNQGGGNTPFNVNTLSQLRTVDATDVDPFDAKIHLRATMASLLQGGHTDSQVTYVFATAQNASQGNLVIGSQFDDGVLPGVPRWTDPFSTPPNLTYSGWQLVDLSGAAGAVRQGDQVRVWFVGAACAGGSHLIGSMLLDGTGSFVPGISLLATAPQKINAGTALTYTYRLSNYGTTPVNSPNVSLSLPSQTRLLGVDPSAAPYCALPDSAGTLHCTFPMLGVANSRSFTVQVGVTNGASGQIAHTQYSVQGDGAPPLYGPAVLTQISNSSLADLSCSLRSEAAAAQIGATVTYSLRAVNGGPSTVNGASLSVPVPTQLGGMGWQCTPDSGASCSRSAGTGTLTANLSLAAGQGVSCSLTATVLSASGGNSILQANLTPPGGIVDADLRNNLAEFFMGIGPTQPLTLWKNSPGRVVGTPLGLDCNASCSRAITSLPSGSLATLTAMPAEGASFLGWSGTPCQGTTNPCVFTVAGPLNVGAHFTTDPSPCTTDASCRARSPLTYCDGSFASCNAKLPPGMPLPTDAAHRACAFLANPACQTGWCNLNSRSCAAAASAACSDNSMCNDNLCAADGRCGLADFLGRCTADNGAFLCRSHSCGNDATCRASGPLACSGDADCAPTFFCSGSSLQCTASLPEGQPIPNDGLHDGTCTAGNAVACASMACNPATQLCARRNDLPCTQNSECGANLCNADGRCGQQDNGACWQDAQCRSGACLQTLCAVPGATTSGHGLFGGCRSGPDAGPQKGIGTLLGMGALLQMWRRRARRLGRVVCLGLGLAVMPPGGAEAAEAGFGVDSFVGAAAGSRWLSIDSLNLQGGEADRRDDANGLNSLGLRLDGNFAHDPLVVQIPGQRLVAQIVHAQATAGLGVSLAPWPFLRLQARLPWQVYANGTRSADAAHLVAAPSAPMGLGDLGLGATGIWAPASLSQERFGASLQVRVPTGRAAAYAGGDGWAFDLSGLAAGERHHLAYGANLGISFAPTSHSFAGASRRTRLLAGGAVGWQVANRRLWLGLEVPASLVVSGGAPRFSLQRQLAVEPGLGIHCRPTPQWILHLVGSTGLTRALGQPQWRIGLAIDAIPLARGSAVPPVRNEVPPLLLEPLTEAEPSLEPVPRSSAPETPDLLPP
jgi:hypothetical protein